MSRAHLKGWPYLAASKEPGASEPWGSQQTLWPADLDRGDGTQVVRCDTHSKARSVPNPLWCSRSGYQGLFIRPWEVQEPSPIPLRVLARAGRFEGLDRLPPIKAPHLGVGRQGQEAPRKSTGTLKIP